ncbi:MAG: DNA (cytosine-5-)-methyltransferase [Nitrospirota bacterium]|nr:DNA (cytosine-5-)-methyltransferase [Nitrospirota bacterium]
MIHIPDECQAWTDSVLVQQPIKAKDLKEPTVLVRRRIPDLNGPRNEQLLYLPGHPVISLFTGCGGLDIGMEQAGFCSVVQHEWNPAACQTLMMNRPQYFRHAALIQGDIRHTPTSLLLREAGLRVGEAYVVAGGPPCQGFTRSNAKAVKHHDDARNDLVFEYLRVVKEAQPHFFIFENVPGILNFQHGKYFRWFLDEAYAGYYELVYGLVDCSEHGVPQHRVRFICMGTRRDLVECDGTLAALPAPENFSDTDLRTITHAKQLAATRPLFDDELRRITRPPGIRYFPDRPILIPPCPTRRQPQTGDYGRSTSFMDFYDNLERTEPDRLIRSPSVGR